MHDLVVRDLCVTSGGWRSWYELLLGWNVGGEVFIECCLQVHELEERRVLRLENRSSCGVL